MSVQVSDIVHETSMAGDAFAGPDAHELLRVLQRVARGDFSARLPVYWDGIAGKIADALNEIVEKNETLALELERVGEMVGKRGKTQQRVRFDSAAGSWMAMERSVNELIGDLLRPMTEVTSSIAAVAQGDLSHSVPLEFEGRELEGEFLRSARIVNRMIDQMNVFTAEVTRVARQVGAEGKLGGQALVNDVSGVWHDLTENVNSMADNLTAQVRNISEVTIAVASGDLSRKITVDSRGEILQLKEAINTMVDQLRSFASEVTRVAREVGTEGKLGGQAIVPGVAGTWKDLTDNVNVMAANLTDQVRGIAEVATAIARGDLSRKITFDVKGELLELKNTINTMVDQLNSFASEVTRVAREVGTEGKLGGQAVVPGVAGTWKDLTDNVNSMASNLTSQVRNIAEVTTAVARGDLSRKITVDVKGELLELKNTINTMVDQLNSFASEVTRVAREVGTEGKLGGHAAVPDVAGTWKDLTDHVNSMGGNLTAQVRNIAEVATAIARGDLSRKITVDVKGELLELKNTINTMVDQLNGFAAEVTRVAREVGTEGRLGGQAAVPGVAGTWKDLTDNVNVMAANLTNQVRGIVKVVTAVATGDLSQKLTVESKGEIAALASTINSMTDTLAIFADQVTTVAREVGVEGRLGGQAAVPGAAGTWKDLTANVNLLAANLSTQVRAIADVATAVTKGDLTQSIQVEARGEVADLKNYINTMIGNLRETTDRTTHQDWLKTNLAKFSRMMQGQRDLNTVAQMLLSELAPLVSARQAVMYIMTETASGIRLRKLASYADSRGAGEPADFAVGEGLIGQCAQERRAILLQDIPADSIRVSTGIIDLIPRSVIVLPVLFERQVKAVIELASLRNFTPSHRGFLEQLTDIVGVVLNNIEVSMRTERLLAQSQQLAAEQQAQQLELKQTNEELARKAQLLATQNVEVERKNQEIEQARRALEEKATELALTSRYKSEFLANMSHELRTPLNSILVLGQQLAENADSNLMPRQVEYARTIYDAGRDLLNLISDILDLSKIESGTVSVESEELEFSLLRDSIERGFQHEAEIRGLAFSTSLSPSLPATISTDPKRLLQVLKNLLSNAFKFTEAGSVALDVFEAEQGWGPGHPALDRASRVIAFAVTDTGIGIAPHQQKIVFEAFQQGDAGTARKHGGTGLGLAISRELAHLLGGEISLVSEPGRGSVFTLFVPASLATASVPAERTDPPLVHEASRAPYLIEDAAEGLVDDRAAVRAEDEVLLIVDGDRADAETVLDFARARGLKGIVAAGGEEALRLAYLYRPFAVTLAASLSDMAGWALLRQLKQDDTTRHIPVQVFAGEEARNYALMTGASGLVAKPLDTDNLSRSLARLRSLASHERRAILIVETGMDGAGEIATLVGNQLLDIVAAESGPEASRLLRLRQFDCVAVHQDLPEMSGLGFLASIRDDPAVANVPFILHAPAGLSAEERASLMEISSRLVLREVRSLDRLLEECVIYLHQRTVDLPRRQQDRLRALRDSDRALAGRRVLIVDDDERNLFALSSVLERHSLEIVLAGTGRDAIEVMHETPDVSLILLDIMMPEMDGYETLRRIRAIRQFQRLPIVALTAKAMKGDREKCLAAGASDYLAKPVDADRLLAVLRLWLHR